MDGRTVNTVLGSVPVSDLGVIAANEALLSVLPGAQYAFDIPFDRADIFETIAPKLHAFKAAGGGTIVDSTGMFAGRDLPLLEALSASTGVHVVASTGMGPEELLGGYFLTPQTNPPTPWPAERFADLFGKEITEGMVVPRVQRRAPAGLIVTEATRDGMTATDESLLRGAARAALQTGAAVSFRFGRSAVDEVQVALSENLPAHRTRVAGVDRTGTDAIGLGKLGVNLGLDHVGLNEDPGHLTDAQRAELITTLIAAGCRDQILLSSSAIGVAKGLPPYDLPYSHLLTTFVPFLIGRGVSGEDVNHILTTNPARLLAITNQR